VRIRHVSAVFLLCITVTWAALSPVAARAQGTDGKRFRLTGSFSAGFDSFQEKYSIVDHDTLDMVNELRASAARGALAGTFLRDFIFLEGRARYGEDSYETGGSLKVTKLLFSSVSRIGFEADFMKRYYGPFTTYQFPNNYTRLFLRGHFRHLVTRSFALRLTDRVERQNFQQRTEFDYDYLRNRISLAGELEWGFATFLDLRLDHVTMSIPDSSEIEYESLVPAIELRHFSGLHKRVILLTAVERRDYTVGSPRSSFWAALGSFMGEWEVDDTKSLLFENIFEWYKYDEKNAIYFDYVENRTALLFKLNPTMELSFGAGPTYGFLDSDVSDQDEYSEYGVKTVFEYNRGARAWITLAYETGKRHYKAFSMATGQLEDLSLFSDYSYHRLSLFTNFRLVGGFTFNGFVDFEPEDHEREGDDATATLISLSVNYFF
jgi:hypothetical protein